jgi:hypothetical protein
MDVLSHSFTKSLCRLISSWASLLSILKANLVKLTIPGLKQRSLKLEPLNKPQLTIPNDLRFSGTESAEK